MLADNIRLKNINHITYNVKDKDAALKWYEDVLGVKQIPKMVNSDHLYWLQLPRRPTGVLSKRPGRQPHRDLHGVRLRRPGLGVLV